MCVNGLRLANHKLELPWLLTLKFVFENVAVLLEATLNAWLHEGANDGWRAQEIRPVCAITNPHSFYLKVLRVVYIL